MIFGVIIELAVGAICIVPGILLWKSNGVPFCTTTTTNT